MNDQAAAATSPAETPVVGWAIQQPEYDARVERVLRKLEAQ